MKHLLLIPLLFFTITLSAQWQHLPGPSAGNVTCWASSDAGVLFTGGMDGLFTSIDDGKTWTRLPSNTLSAQRPIQLEWDNSNLYLTTADYNTDDRNLWKSTDNGLSWVKLWSDLVDDIEFLSLFDARNDTIMVGASPNNHMSFDGGQNWIFDNSSPGSRNLTGTKQGWFKSFYSGASRWQGGWTWSQVYMSNDEPTFPRRILEAGEFVFIFFSGDTNLFKYTTNGGTTWKDGILPIDYNENEVSIGLRNDTIFVQGKSGIAISTDGLQNWQSLPTPGLTGSVSKCFFTNSGAIVACTERGIFRADKPGAEFLPTEGYSSPNVRTVLRENNGAWWLGLSDGLFFSPDNGATWRQKLTQFGSADLDITMIKKSGNSVIAASRKRLFYSPDNGLSWTERSLPSSSISTVEVLGQRVFTGEYSGCWYSDDWGASWQAFIPNAANPSAAAQLYAENDSFLACSASWSGVYFSRDTGATWLNYSAGLSGGVSEIAMSAEYIYAVASNKLYRTPYNAPAWQQVQVPTYIPSGTTLTPWAFHFTDYQILAGIPTKGVFKQTTGTTSWTAFPATDLNYRSNAFSFSDSLIIMLTNGGVYYIGAVSSEVIGGRAYIDANQNAVFDSTDTALSGQLVELMGQPAYACSDEHGRYAFDWRGHPDSVALKVYSSGVNVKPARHLVNGPGTAYDFSISTHDYSTDLSVDLTASTPPRPGFKFTIFVYCQNNGALPAQVGVSFYKDTATSWVSYNVDPDLIFTDSAQWQLLTIPAGSTVMLEVTLEVGANVPIGKILEFYALITPLNIADQRPDNNLQHYSVQVVGSFDPNDKSVLPGGNISPAMVADSQVLTYTIRFQNTGNYPAEFVRVTDLLSPSLDLGSLRLISSSHPCTWSLNGRMVEFFFPNIQLADSISNEAGSHGFVKFSVATRKDLEIGDGVKNFADIFFDFNSPVRTNTVQTQVAEVSSGAVTPIPVLSCSVSPNPVKERLSVAWESPAGARDALLQIFDLSGKMVLSTRSASPANVSVKTLPAGAYRLWILSDGVTGQSVFIKQN